MHTLEVYGVWEGKSICQEKGNTVSNVSNKVYGVHSRVAGVLAELGGLSPQPRKIQKTSSAFRIPEISNFRLRNTRTARSRRSVDDP